MAGVSPTLLPFFRGKTGKNGNEAAIHLNLSILNWSHILIELNLQNINVNLFNYFTEKLVGEL